jgi:hypothetical protein
LRAAAAAVQILVELEGQVVLAVAATEQALVHQYRYQSTEQQIPAAAAAVVELDQEVQLEFPELRVDLVS